MRNVKGRSRVEYMPRLIVLHRRFASAVTGRRSKMEEEAYIRQLVHLILLYSI